MSWVALLATTYMVEKLPLGNDFLKTVTAIDPIAILDKMTCYIKSYLTSARYSHKCFVIYRPYKTECRKIMVDPTLPPALVAKKFVRAGTWWFKL